MSHSLGWSGQACLRRELCAETGWCSVKQLVSTRGGFGSLMINARREGGGDALAGLTEAVDVRSRWWQCSRAVEGTPKMFSLLDCAIAGD